MTFYMLLSIALPLHTFVTAIIEEEEVTSLMQFAATGDSEPLELNADMRGIEFMLLVQQLALEDVLANNSSDLLLDELWHRADREAALVEGQVLPELRRGLSGLDTSVQSALSLFGTCEDDLDTRNVQKRRFWDHHDDNTRAHQRCSREQAYTLSQLMSCTQLADIGSDAESAEVPSWTLGEEFASPCTAQSDSHKAKVQECHALQLRQNEAACALVSYSESSCNDYGGCHSAAEASFALTVDAVKASGAELRMRWLSALAPLCVVHAAVRTIGDGGDYGKHQLNKDLQECGNALRPLIGEPVRFADSPSPQHCRQIGVQDLVHCRTREELSALLAPHLSGDVTMREPAAADAAPTPSSAADAAPTPSSAADAAPTPSSDPPSTFAGALRNSQIALLEVARKLHVHSLLSNVRSAPSLLTVCLITLSLVSVVLCILSSMTDPDQARRPSQMPTRSASVLSKSQDFGRAGRQHGGSVGHRGAGVDRWHGREGSAAPLPTEASMVSLTSHRAFRLGSAQGLEVAPPSSLGTASLCPNLVVPDYTECVLAVPSLLRARRSDGLRRSITDKKGCALLQVDLLQSRRAGDGTAPAAPPAGAAWSRSFVECLVLSKSDGEELAQCELAASAPGQPMSALLLRGAGDGSAPGQAYARIHEEIILSPPGSDVLGRASAGHLYSFVVHSVGAPQWELHVSGHFKRREISVVNEGGQVLAMVFPGFDAGGASEFPFASAGDYYKLRLGPQADSCLIMLSLLAMERLLMLQQLLGPDSDASPRVGPSMAQSWTSMAGPHSCSRSR